MSDLWDDDELHVRARSRARYPWITHIAIGVGLVAFVGMLAWGALALLGDHKALKRMVVDITLVAPPPTPPPPPEVKPPEPEVEQEVKVPEPEPPPQAEAAPPTSEQLGLDAEGSGNGDGFGLAAKKGGTDITKLGGTANRAQVAWFTGLVQSHLESHFRENGGLRKADYGVVMRVWFGRDGRVERYELVGSSGNPEIDRNLKLAMDAMPAMRQPPPVSMPQPVKLRVSSRGSG